MFNGLLFLIPLGSIIRPPPNLPLYGRLGALEQPLNVAATPTKGSESPFVTEGKGLQMGPLAVLVIDYCYCG